MVLKWGHIFVLTWYVRLGLTGGGGHVPSPKPLDPPLIIIIKMESNFIFVSFCFSLNRDYMLSWSRHLKVTSVVQVGKFISSRYPVVFNTKSMIRDHIIYSYGLADYIRLHNHRLTTPFMTWIGSRCQLNRILTLFISLWYGIHLDCPPKMLLALLWVG